MYEQEELKDRSFIDELGDLMHEPTEQERHLIVNMDRGKLAGSSSLLFLDRANKI